MEITEEIFLKYFSLLDDLPVFLAQLFGNDQN